MLLQLAILVIASLPKAEETHAEFVLPHLQAKKSELKTKACQLMGLEVDDVRMWDFFGGTELYANMEDQLDDELTAQSNALIDKQHILLEERVCKLALP